MLYPLPLQELRECFETRNIPKLNEVLSKLPKEEAAYHMRRCVDSGLWVSDAKAAGKGGGGGGISRKQVNLMGRG